LEPDIDLLILLIQFSKQDNQLDVYMYKLGTGKYDTTSDLYRQGKKKAFTLLQKNADVQDRVVRVFNNTNSSPDSVSSVGDQTNENPRKLKSKS